MGEAFMPRRGGTIRQMWSSGTPLGKLAVGTSVYIPLSGTPTEFIVVHQGLPSADYDVSCDGTWVLMKNIFTKLYYADPSGDYSNDYWNSYINEWLNLASTSKFLGKISSDIRAKIKGARIPIVSDGAATVMGTLPKVFLLSSTEYNAYCYNSIEKGAALAYFSEGTAGEKNAKRQATYNGTAIDHYTRSPSSNATDVGIITSEGGSSIEHCTYTEGVRPAMILKSDELVVDSDMIVKVK